MPAQYKLFVGDQAMIDRLLTELPATGWKPILMSATATGRGVEIAVIFEQMGPAGNRVEPPNIPGVDPMRPPR